MGLESVVLPTLRPRPLTLASLGLGSKQYSAAIYFTLALFSLVNQVNIRLQAELEEGENPVQYFQGDGRRCRDGGGCGYGDGQHGVWGSWEREDIGVVVRAVNTCGVPVLTILFLLEMNWSPRNPWRRRRSQV